MAENFYERNRDIQFYIDTYLDLKSIIDLKEGFYEGGDEDAPTSYEEALDQAKSVLHYMGDICLNTIYPNAAKVDEEGAQFDAATKTVKMAQGTLENLTALSEGGLMGVTLPRKYGGMNQCETILVSCIEMLSSADASLMTIWGLQGIGETIYHFADDDVKDKYLPQLASGESTAAMVLTEANAGSDLGSVAARAHFDEASQKWLINGSKRFITNGGGELMLVLARTEEETDGDVRGLSMFLVEQKEVEVTRLEHKLGINGSPTCEMIFENSAGILIGKRRFGLVKYLFSLMNSARLGCAAQGLGIAQIAFDEAAKYAGEREQFGTKIGKFPAVADLLVNMKLEIEGTRAIVYNCAQIVDMYVGLEKRAEVLKEKAKDLAGDEKKALSDERKKCVDQGKMYRQYADILTPLAKMKSGDMVIRVTSDAVQVLGGVGYTKEFPVERFFRDARIVDIYEGTGQLQVKAAISGVLNGYLMPLMANIKERCSLAKNDSVSGMLKSLDDAVGDMNEAIAFVKAKSSTPDYEIFLHLNEAKLCKMVMDVYVGYLLVDQSTYTPRKLIVAENYIRSMIHRVKMQKGLVLSAVTDTMTKFKEITEVDIDG